MGNFKCAIGQDSHPFEENISDKPLVLGGVVFDNMPKLHANSDGDVVLHALANAISGISGVNILGSIADELCKAGNTDSSVYVSEALKYLAKTDSKITHVSFTIECLRPKISPKVDEMKEKIASMLGITSCDVGITATTGEGLTQFGQGLGISVFCIITCN